MREYIELKIPEKKTAVPEKVSKNMDVLIPIEVVVLLVVFFAGFLTYHWMMN